MFQLHSKLAEDTVLVGRLELSLVLLHRDSQYPWCILVPQRETVTEIHHLDLGDRQRLMVESCFLAEVMVDLFAPRKMNVAALGNMVPQLHLHHVARFAEDNAWPHPIWGRSPPVFYRDSELNARLERLRHALAGEGFIASSA
jgi:diadenosine tetraphosphate (Ap4A) HIT family hydrolase